MINLKVLKQSLIQDAMRGKLTKQNPKDNAKQLLKNIQYTKCDLVNKNKIKRSKKLPLINKNTIPFKISRNWKWARLGQLVLIKHGQDIYKRNQSRTNSTNDIPYLTGASNFKSSHIVTRSFINKKLANVISIKGDLLITVAGTIGKLAFLPFKKAQIGDHIVAMRFIGDINPMFIYYLLQSAR